MRTNVKIMYEYLADKDLINFLFVERMHTNQHADNSLLRMARTRRRAIWMGWDSALTIQGITALRYSSANNNGGEVCAKKPARSGKLPSVGGYYVDRRRYSYSRASAALVGSA